MANAISLPPTAIEQARLTSLYHFSRVQMPTLSLPQDRFNFHIHRTFDLFVPKARGPLSWSDYLASLYIVDWSVCIGCLERLDTAWDILFAAKTGRSDCLLIDALRARSSRLYPRDEERQETAVTEFWSNLIASDTAEAKPVLARYDGQRPLAPWLIRVFQNWHLSKLRQHSGVISLPDDDLAVPIPSQTVEETRWHELFISAAREWLSGIDDQERLLLGLRWRYRMSQRDVANILGVHEGTISRQTDKLRDKALESLGESMVQQGWTGDDVSHFVLNELGGVLTDDPRLSAEHLGALLSKKGKSLAV
ncbi:hypothetical protein BH11PLA2_BH11PLA2_51580 [soil metagenome]